MGWLARLFGQDDRPDKAKAAARAEELSTVLAESDRVLMEKDRAVELSRDRVAEEFRRVRDAMKPGARP